MLDLKTAHVLLSQKPGMLKLQQHKPTPKLIDSESKNMAIIALPFLKLKSRLLASLLSSYDTFVM